MAHFPYVSADNQPASLMPRMPLRLILGGQSVEVVGLLDTGAAVSVLPYQVGLALGAVWQEQTTSVPLVGSLGQFEARALVVMASHPFSILIYYLPYPPKHSIFLDEYSAIKLSSGCGIIIASAWARNNK